MHKYYTWTDSEGYFRGQQLLHRTQIAELLKYTAKPTEAFATIQDYDAEGNCIGCPLYFDIDSPSLWDAYHEMQELVEDLRATLEVEPSVWFSGSKGFHVVCPIYIRHERCHEIVKMMVDDVTDIGDRSVYRTRSMWRCDNTWNAKGERFKNRVRPELSLDAILVQSKNKHDGTIHGWSMRDAKIDSYVAKLPTYTERIQTISGDFEQDFKPCMKTLWQMSSPPEGSRHNLCHLMARHCYRSGLSINEAIALFDDHPYWGTVRRSEGHFPEKIIRSVYRSGKAMIGCKNGIDSELLQPYCSKMCNLNDEVNILDFIKM